MAKKCHMHCFDCGSHSHFDTNYRMARTNQHDQRAVRCMLVAPIALFCELTSYRAFREDDFTSLSMKQIYCRAAIQASHSIK